MRAKLDYQKVSNLIETREEVVVLLQMVSNLWTYTPRIAGSNFQELRKCIPLRTHSERIMMGDGKWSVLIGRLDYMCASITVYGGK